MSSQIILSLKGLSKTFGNINATKDVSLDLHKGEVLALLGENGAGKTTLMNMLFGHYLPNSGKILISDNDGVMDSLSLGQPQAALSKGIGMVHQHFTLAENLTALDNILIGSEPLWAFKVNAIGAREKVKVIIEKSGLDVSLDVPVGQLSVGERQRVEILKALYREAKILVLDEPTAVLTPKETDILFDNIKNMTASGLSVIFISHKLKEVLKFSDRIVVLRDGKKVGELLTSDANEKIIANLMVGEDTTVRKRDQVSVGKELLSISNVSAKGTSVRNGLINVSMSIFEHEIVGVAGVSGNGQSMLAEVISGLRKPDAGELSFDSQISTNLSPKEVIKAGVGRIPEDRHRDGIIGSMTVAENLIIENLDNPKIRNFGFLNHDLINSSARELCEKYDVRGPGTHASAKFLSGGNIQKMILARVFNNGPKIILANQPTRGLDMGAASEVERRLLNARSRGAGTILISEDLDEILRLSDRILVIHGGILMETRNKDREQIGLMMAGEREC